MSCKPLGTRRCRSHMFVNLKVVWRTTRTQALEYIYGVWKAQLNLWNTYWELAPDFDSILIHLLTLVCPSIIAFGDPLGTPYKCCTNALVLATISIYTYDNHKWVKSLGHLHFQASFKGLVPIFVWCSQWVKYAGPSILRIDYKCNPVAREAHAAQTKYR
jgi:hypothetical protein